MLRTLSLAVWLLLMDLSYTYTVKQIYQFSNSSFNDIENVAARSNGQLLLNLITEPSTYYVDPTRSNARAQHHYTFQNGTFLAGIAEYAPDVFPIVVRNYSIATYAGVLGSFAVWSLDLRWPGAPIVKAIAYPRSQSSQRHDRCQRISRASSHCRFCPWSRLGLKCHDGQLSESHRRSSAWPIKPIPAWYQRLTCSQKYLVLYQSGVGSVWQSRDYECRRCYGECNKVLNQEYTIRGIASGVKFCTCLQLMDVL